MRIMRQILAAAAVGAMLIPFGAMAANSVRPGPMPMVLASENFAFTKGAWATYDVESLRTNQHYRMWVAVVDVVKKKGRTAAWMEFSVQMEGQSNVLTRCLVDASGKGPGEVYEAIVQVEGMRPFRVPKKYLKDSSKGAPVVTPVLKEVKSRTETMAWQGRQLEVVRVDATDNDGRTIHTVVSPAVPPLAIVTAETADARLKLESWGLDATSRMKGKPRSFFMWILESIWDAF